MFDEVYYDYTQMLNRYAIMEGLLQHTFLMGDKSNEFRAIFGVLDIDGDAWCEEQGCIAEAVASSAEVVYE